MQSERLQELERRASESSLGDQLRQLEARQRVHHEIELMKAEGKAMELSAEEESMLYSFRRFKLRMRKTSEMFSWQTQRPDGVQVVQETANILHPSEVA